MHTVIHTRQKEGTPTDTHSTPNDATHRLKMAPPKEKHLRVMPVLSTVPISGNGGGVLSFRRSWPPAWTPAWTAASLPEQLLFNGVGNVVGVARGLHGWRVNRTVSGRDHCRVLSGTIVVGENIIIMGRSFELDHSTVEDC